MAITRLITTLCTSFATSIRDAIDAGSGPGLIRVYAGTMPASPETAITSQILLGTLTLSDPCGVVSGKTITFNAITQDISADADGVITFCRIVDSNGNTVIDGDATDMTGNGMFKFNTTTIVATGPIRMASGSVTVG